MFQTTNQRLYQIHFPLEVFWYDRIFQHCRLVAHLMKWSFLCSRDSFLPSHYEIATHPFSSRIVPYKCPLTPSRISQLAMFDCRRVRVAILQCVSERHTALRWALLFGAWGQASCWVEHSHWFGQSRTLRRKPRSLPAKGFGFPCSPSILRFFPL